MSRSAERGRRRVTVLVTTGVVVAGFGLWPAAAGADPDPLAIGVARTVATEHGSFRVPVWTDAAGGTVTSVTAAIRDGDTTVTTLDLVDGGNGFWAPAAPLELTDDGGVMPHLGHYAIDVTATDDQSDTASREEAGTLNFTLRPEFDPTSATGLRFDPAVLDRSHPTGAVSGTVLGIRPGSGTTVPIGQHAVTVERTNDGGSTPQVTTTTTQDDGTFTVQGFARPGSGYFATFTSGDETVDGSASSTYARPDLDVVTGYLTASANLKRALSGQKVTISGVARTGPSTSSPGLGNVPVVISLNGSQVTVPTGSNGHFSGVVTATPGFSYPSTWTVAFSSPFVYNNSTEGSIVTPSEASFTGTGITLRSDGYVTAHGDLVATYGGFFDDSGLRASLQYSKDGKTNWKILASATNYAGAFSFTAGGYASGYYRLYHATSNGLAATATKPVHLSRIVTRIYGNNAAPEPVKKGATVTVTGTLQEQRGVWRPMGSRVLGLFFLATGAKTWTLYASGRTDTHGHAKLRAKASKTGKWLLQYFGDSTHFDSYGTADAVTVH